MFLRAFIITILMSSAASFTQAAEICSPLFGAQASRFIGGDVRLERLMAENLKAHRDEVARQDLQILASSSRGKHTQSVYIQFVGNTKLNRIIKDSMVPDFFSADLVDTAFRFFEKNPSLGAIAHYDYREVVVHTQLSRTAFEAKLKDFILSEVAKRYSTSQIMPGAPLSKEWIMEHIRLGFGSDPQSAFNDMKLGTKSRSEALQEAFENRERLMSIIAPRGISDTELVRFVRYDLPYPERASVWLKKAGLPENMIEKFKQLRDDYFLFDYLPEPEANPSIVSKAAKLYKSGQAQEAAELLIANGLASWRLQRANALAVLRDMGSAVVISSDQSKLGLANFKMADQTLAQAHAPVDLAKIDVPNARGLYQHHLWLKGEMEKIIQRPGAVRFWLIGDDATWILPTLTSSQMKLVSQFLNQSSSLYYSATKIDSNSSPEQMAKVLAQSRQDLVDNKPTAPRPLGWPVGRMAKLAQDKDAFYLDGVPVQRIGDAWGLANNGIFVYEKNGSPRLLKVLRPEYASDLMKKSDPAEVSEPELLLALLNREYAGMVRAESLGGPKLYNTGVIRLPSGQVSFFIEMENMFAGLPSKTLKTFVRDAKGDLGLLRDQSSGHRSYTEQMAEMIVRAYENGVAPNDPDFIFYAGQMRWLDSGAWESISARTHAHLPMSKKAPAVQVYQRLLAAESQQQTAIKFREDFNRALRMSQSLSLRLKQQLLAGFDEPAPEQRLREAN